MALDLIVSNWRAVGSAYPEKFDEEFLNFKNFVNTLEQRLQGVSSGSGTLAAGLQEIFDRLGIIGTGSYDFDAGVKATEQLSVAAGGYWDGLAYYSTALAATLSLAGLDTGTYYVNIDSAGVPSISASYGTSTTRQFAWDADTKTVSAKALYTGVSILFDGDDYQACRGAYDSLAERLAAMALNTDPFSGYYAQGTHDGLDFYYAAGKVRDDSVISDTGAGDVALADDDTNYVEVDPATGVVSANQVGFTSGLVPLYVVITASGEITDITDQRTAAMVGVAGVGGGHTQGTDTGTTATDFLIDSDAAGNPTGRAGLEVENGDDPNASVKFNRDTGQWEISTDGGVTWSPVLTTDLINQEGQEWTKWVQLASPPTVYEASGRGSSEANETLDISSHLTEAPQGCALVMLRVWFFDSGDTGAELISLMQTGGIPVVDAQSVWSAENHPSLILLAPSVDGEIDFAVVASGEDTAAVKIMLLGYAAKVTGVGTLDRTFTSSGLAVGAGATVDFDLTGFMNRGLVRYLNVTETGGLMAGTYDVEIYARDTFQASDLLYQAQGLAPGVFFIDRLPFGVEDADGSRELHLRLINNDGSNAGTFSITIKAEQFA